MDNTTARELLWATPASSTDQFKVNETKFGSPQINRDIEMIVTGNHEVQIRDTENCSHAPISFIARNFCISSQRTISIAQPSSAQNQDGRENSGKVNTSSKSFQQVDVRGGYATIEHPSACKLIRGDKGDRKSMRNSFNFIRCVCVTREQNEYSEL